ncbi:hypothetical protein [Halobacterium zhouii]|uniref:hypothetical protein n=1 Tax=Halobacterium zhouii TaxID=2902624 RepID=UPI001E3C3206|nr:hypothetical protein [Halobacterium zhouii]
MTLQSNRNAVVAIAVVAMLATSGCAGMLNSEASASGGAKLDSVPANAQMVGYVDAAGAVGDDSLRSLANTMLEAQAENSEYYEGPTSVAGMLDEAKNSSGLDPSNVHSVTFFATAEATSSMNAEHSGMVLASAYSEDELVSAMREEGSELSKSSYKETTLYTYGYSDDSALAVLGDGTFALGDVSAVKSVVDVRAGDQDAVGGDLRATYENTRDGYLRFAMDVPQKQVPADRIGAGSPVNTSAFNTVQFVSGSFYTSADEVGLDVSFTSKTESDASRVHDVVKGGISLYSGMVDDELRNALQKLSVSQSGDTVTVSYVNTVSNLETLLETYSERMSGSTSASGSASSSTSTDSSASLAPLVSA